LADAEAVRLVAQRTPSLVSAGSQAMAPPADMPDFDGLFRAQIQYVGRTLRYLGVDQAHLEDACQEVFVVVHRRLVEYRPDASLRAWIRQICVGVARNRRRSIRRRREDAGGSPPEAVVPPHQQRDLELRHLRDRLLAILEELPAEQRDVFVLYEIEKLTMPEVAEALSCPLQTAYSRLNAARAKVRARAGGGSG
jgi:RNA polymerase sigma-70 factor (ECF subfamily)